MVAEVATKKATEEAAEFQISSLIAPISSPGSVVAESVGALRTHIMARHMRDGRRSLAMCTPSAGAGCTFMAANLAAAMAQAGAKTLLIDGNLREPGLETYFRPNRTGPGLFQCLTDTRLPLGDAIAPDVIPGLSVMLAGGIAPNAQELLAGAEFKEIIDRCMRDFDMTIVDTPPTNMCADGRRVASVLRYALIVVRRHESYVTDLRALADELQSDRVKVVGTFLNDY